MKQHAVVLILVLFAGCAKDDPTAPVPLPLPPSSTGTWSISLDVGFAGTLKISEQETMVDGTGTFLGLSTNVLGENHYPKIAFTVSSAGYKPAYFTGSFSTTKIITGVLNGSGFANTNFTLTKN
jgi:hypothetical protein